MKKNRKTGTNPGKAALTSAFLIITIAAVYTQTAPLDDAAAFEEGLFAETGGQFAEAPASGLQENGEARTEYLLGGTVIVQTGGTYSGEKEDTAFSSTIGGKLFAKVGIPDYGALYIAYNGTHSFFQGYAGDGIPPQARDPYSPSWTLSELHWSFDVAKAVFVRLGNQIISWGPSRIWSPVDFINARKKDSFALLDARAGKPGLRVHVPLPGSNAFLFGDFSGLVTENSGIMTAGDPLETVNVSGRFDFTALSFEFGMTAYGGKNAQANLGLDASGRLFGTTVYGEWAIRPSYGDYDFSSSASFGFSRPLDELKRWNFQAEGFWNSAGKDLSDYDALTILTLDPGERTPLYSGKWYANASLQADKLILPELSSAISVIANLSESSYRAQFTETLAFPGVPRVDLSIAYSGGGKNKEFTRYAGNDAVEFAIKTRMEF